MSELIEKLARAMRKARFERTGVGGAFDPDMPATQNERDDARAILSTLADNLTPEMVRDAKTAALVALAEHGPTTDMQAALLNGDGRGTLKPGALDAMTKAALTAALRSAVGE